MGVAVDAEEAWGVAWELMTDINLLTMNGLKAQVKKVERSREINIGRSSEANSQH